MGFSRFDQHIRVVGRLVLFDLLQAQGYPLQTALFGAQPQLQFSLLLRQHGAHFFQTQFLV